MNIYKLTCLIDSEFNLARQPVSTIPEVEMLGSRDVT